MPAYRPFDFHAHGGDAGRSGEIAEYIRRGALSGLGLLSLPLAGYPGTDGSRPHLNGEVLESKRRLHRELPGVPVYAFGCLDNRNLIGGKSENRFAEGQVAGRAADDALGNRVASAVRESVAVTEDRRAAGAVHARHLKTGAVPAVPADAADADDGAAGSKGRKPRVTEAGFADTTDADDAAAQVAALADAGFDGLKLWEGKPAMAAALGLMPDSPRIVAACREAGRRGMPVIFHVADPPEFWGPGAGGLSLAGAEVPGYDELIDGAARLCRDAPETVLVFPHLLFLAADLERAAAFLEAAPNAFFDLAPGNYAYQPLSKKPGRSAEFFAAWRNRILFGSDAFFFAADAAPLAGDSLEGNRRRIERLLEFLSGDGTVDNPYPLSSPDTRRVRCLQLPDAVLEPILHGNAHRIFPLPPSEVTP